MLPVTLPRRGAPLCWRALLPKHLNPTPRVLPVPPELQIVLYLVALVGLWFLLTRSTRASQRRVAALQAEIEIGDEVILSAGIFGTVRSLDGDKVQLEIAEGTVITVARQVVVRRAPDAEAPTTDEHDPED
ncbi:preprotein translocase subunit YajC [Nocardioides marmoriginsengisoli]|uniref:Preprotein translocase subunit YajC n=1 Tax=Nocardioides marmoriginsengisoli TaxID=661483 RepID=A0A3N0CL03_9ACTN|nr:preprotein translocase subunit YajC [Nocardioides marmoriginsengisoli]